MSQAVNKVILIGFLGRDPETRFTPRGSRVTRFSLATSEIWGSGEERREHTEWHTVAVWNRLAEVADAYLHRGSKVYIEGCLRNRRWQGRDGNARQRTEVLGERLLLLDPPPGVSLPAEDEFAEAGEYPF